MRHSVSLFAAVLLGFASFAAPAQAEVINFSFQTPSYDIASGFGGTGSFSTTSDTGTFSLGNGLTNFTLGVTELFPFADGSFTVLAAHLISASATVNAGTLTSFSFTTDTFVLNANPDTAQITATLGPDNVAITDNIEGNPGFLSGTLTISAVPEPSTWAMMILGLMGIGFMACRNRKDAVLAV
jgi:hypothetical protein